MTNEEEIRAQSSMTYWWPKLRAVDVPTPQTVRIPSYDHTVEDSSDAPGGFHVKRPEKDDVHSAVEEVGGPPAFLRSDQMSAKHRMEEGSKISSLEADHLGLSIWTIAERNKMAMMVPPPECYYVREWLELDHRFTAFGGTPIAAELRFFLKDGGIWDYGFYWPADAINRPSTDDWQQQLSQTRAAAFNSSERVEKLAERVAGEFDGYWSCDFALTAQSEAIDNPNTWYCIDMARGEASWHPDTVQPPESVDR